LPGLALNAPQKQRLTVFAEHLKKTGKTNDFDSSGFAVQI